MKKSFLIHLDSSKATVDKLSNEEAGILFKAFIEYNSSGIVPPMDRVIDMAFTSFKAQFDRDATKWEDVAEKKREAGRQGGIRSGESRQATKQIKAHEASASAAKQSKQESANEAVSVNENVTANESNSFVHSANERVRTLNLDDYTDEQLILLCWQKFYKTYPKKRNKIAAKTAYEKSFKGLSKKKIIEHARIILHGLNLAVEDWERQGVEMQFIPYPAKWISGECWNDEYSSEKNETNLDELFGVGG